MTVLARRDQQTYRMDSRVEEEMEAFKMTLMDSLTENNKASINMLTLIAEDNHQFAQETVNLIDQHIHQVNVRMKLPALYLIDSIVKNIDPQRGDYKTRFRSRLVGITAHVFRESTDERVRRAIFRLRETWTGFYDQAFLNHLDKTIQQIDPQWQPMPAPVTTNLSVPQTNRPHPLQLSVSEPPVKKPSPPTTPPEAAERPGPEGSVATAAVVAPVRRLDLPIQTVASVPVPVRRPEPLPAQRNFFSSSSDEDDLPPGTVVPVKRQEHKPKFMAKSGPNRNVRTEIPQKRDPAVSVSMGSLEPPKAKPTMVAGKKASSGPVNKKPEPVRKPEPVIPSEPLSDPVVSTKRPRIEKDEPNSLPVQKTPVADEPTPAAPKVLPKVPRKAVSQTNRGGHLDNTVQESDKTAPLPRGRLTRDPNAGVARTMPRIPKKNNLSQRDFPDDTRRKIQKTNNERPPENRTLLPSPSPALRGSRAAAQRGQVRPGFTRYPTAVPRMDQPSRHEFNARHRPYPDREQRERPRWTPPELHQPYYPPVPEHFPAHPPVPLAPPLPAIDPRTLFELKLEEEVKRNIASGAINEGHIPGFTEKARREFELQQLHAAVSRSLDPVRSRDFSVRLAGGPINYVSIDNEDHEVWWVQNKPVVVKDGAILDIGFIGAPVDVFINEIKVATLAVHESRTVYIGGGYHKIKFGGPNFELILDDETWCRVSFNSPVGAVLTVDGMPQRVRLGGPAPLVEIGSVRLNDQIFGQSPADAKSSSDADTNAELQRILANPHFAGLLARTATPPAAAEQPPVAAVVAPLAPAVPERRPSPVPDLPELDPQGESGRLYRILKNEQNARKKLHDVSGPNKFPTLVDGLAPPTLAAPVDDHLFLSNLAKLHLNVGFCCTRCEERFLTEEGDARVRNIVVHNGFTQKFKDGLHVADWLLGAEEFISEKSFECDTSVEDLQKMFSIYSSSMRVAKREEEVELDGDVGSGDGGRGFNRQESHTAEFDIMHRPVVASSQKNICTVCLEEIVAEENEDDDLDLDFKLTAKTKNGHDWILKDGIQATSRADGTVKIYHRDCFDQNVRQRPVIDVVVTPKPNRWASTTIETPVLVNPAQQRLQTRRPSDSTVQAPLVQQPKESLPSDEVVPSTSDSVVKSQDSEFVIRMGDDDDDEDEDEYEDDFVNSNFDL